MNGDWPEDTARRSTDVKGRSGEGSGGRKSRGQKSSGVLGDVSPHGQTLAQVRVLDLLRANS